MTRERAPELPQRRRKVSRRLICASEIKREAVTYVQVIFVLLNLGTQLPLASIGLVPALQSTQASQYTQREARKEHSLRVIVYDR